MTIAYTVKNGLYLNITNRCPCDCVFCLRNKADGVYGSGPLWLEREPTVEEILDALGRYDIADFSEIVFCGYGEPTERLDAVVAVAKYIKTEYPTQHIRLNTNGLSDLINDRSTAQSLAGLIDTVSISMNAPDAAGYMKLCRPSFGEVSWQAMIDFAESCRGIVPKTVLSIVGEPVTTRETQDRCGAIARSIGVGLRIRPYED